jgi:arylsulfatase A-like enzyme
VAVGWPSGVHQTFGPVEVDRTVRIEEAPQDVILIVIDTQRSQNMSIYGYGRETSPALAAFARDAVTYERAVSPSTWTVPSHGSLLTGRWPSYHGAERVAGDKLQAMPINPDLPTLAELLRAAGYRTAAFVANYTYVSPLFGFHRGFEVFDDEAKFFRAEEILAKAEQWLAAQREPAFLFVNLIDPHEPYEPPPPYDGMYPGKGAGYGGSFRELLHVQHRALTAAMREHFVSQYDGETAYTDHALGHFLDRLRALGRYRSSLVIVTSDHGELLGEHGLAGHGVWPWEEQVRVPLLVKYPGSRGGGRRVAARVSNLGVFAAALRAAGLGAPEGVDPDPFDPTRPVFVEDLDFNGHRVRAVYEGSRKLISSVDPAGNEWTSLYDLDADPQERRPLDLELDASSLRRTLADFRSPARPSNQAERPIIDAERERKLRELGYVR